MNDNIDDATGRACNARLLAGPALLSVGVSVAIGWLAWQGDEEPYRTPFFHLFFSNTLHMRAWLTAGAAVLGLG